MIYVAVSLAQPGICRVVSLGAYSPFLLVGLFISVTPVVKPERLVLARDGLTYSAPWRKRHWSWDEIRDIKLVKSQSPIPFVRWFWRARPASSIYFTVFQPPGHARGPARYALRSVWAFTGDEVASLLETARRRWSTPAGVGFVPAPGLYGEYMRTGLPLAVVFGTLWMWYAQPCAR